MQIVIDEVDHSLYADVILSPSDLVKLEQREMLSGEIIFKRRKCYIGIRIQGPWDYNYEEKDEEGKQSFESNEGIF